MGIEGEGCLVTATAWQITEAYVIEFCLTVLFCFWFRKYFFNPQLRLLDHLLHFLGVGLSCGIIDASYCSWVDGKITWGSVIPFFVIVWNDGCLFCVGMVGQSNDSTRFRDVMASVAYVTVSELAHGLWDSFYLGCTYWDYSGSSYNFFGLIDVLHTFLYLCIIMNLFAARKDPQTVICSIVSSFLFVDTLFVITSMEQWFRMTTVVNCLFFLYFTALVLFPAHWGSFQKFGDALTVLTFTTMVVYWAGVIFGPSFNREPFFREWFEHGVPFFILALHPLSKKKPVDFSICGYVWVFLFCYLVFMVLYHVATGVYIYHAQLDSYFSIALVGLASIPGVPLLFHGSSFLKSLPHLFFQEEGKDKKLA